MLVPWRGLHVTADLVAGDIGQKDIGQDEIRIHLFQAKQGCISVGDSDYFEAFFAQDALAHALGMGTIVGQKDTNN